jgi:hypothetical protein
MVDGGDVKNPSFIDGRDQRRRRRSVFLEEMRDCGLWCFAFYFLVNGKRFLFYLKTKREGICNSYLPMV